MSTKVKSEAESRECGLPLQLTVELYEMLEVVNRKVEHLRFVDPISDFLYPLASVFTHKPNDVFVFHVVY